MKITILCVGKIKEKFYREALEEYVKRLGRYSSMNIIELADEKTPDDASDKECEAILTKEGDRILSHIPDNSYVFALAIEGKRYTSEAFADKLDVLMSAGNSHIVFVIGGSLGLSDAVKKRADALISFSDMTFPHQLMRVILAEQIYRCFRIIKHEPYHK